MKGKVIVVTLSIYALSTLVIMILSIHSNVVTDFTLKRRFTDTARIIEHKLSLLEDAIRVLLRNTDLQFGYEKSGFLPVQDNNNISCDFYNVDASRARTTVERIWKDTLDIPIETVTMVIQLTMDRIDLLDLHIQNWSGPMSVALYVKREELKLLGDSVGTMVSLLMRDNVDLHIMLHAGIFHPVNHLRNLALRNVFTQYVLYNDADFIPSKEAYERILQHIKQGALQQKQVLVVPALEFGGLTSHSFPEDVASAKEHVISGSLVPFHQVKLNTRFFSPGHVATNTNRWSQTQHPYTVNWTSVYEPYMVGQKAELPLYDERLVGRGLNKVSHTLNIHALGFKFLVLPDVYLIHYPHERNYSEEYLRVSYQCSDIAYNKIYKRLELKYPEQFRTKVQTDSSDIYSNVYNSAIYNSAMLSEKDSKSSYSNIDKDAILDLSKTNHGAIHPRNHTSANSKTYSKPSRRKPSHYNHLVKRGGGGGQISEGQPIGVTPIDVNSNNVNRLSVNPSDGSQRGGGVNSALIVNQNVNQGGGVNKLDVNENIRSTIPKESVNPSTVNPNGDVNTNAEVVPKVVDEGGVNTNVGVVPKVVNQGGVNSMRGGRTHQPNTKRRRKPPKRSTLFIYRKGGGKIGNQLYWFGSTYGIARYHGRKNIWGSNNWNHLLTLFPGIRKHMRFTQKEILWPEMPTRRRNFDPRVLMGLPKENLYSKWFTHSYRYFRHVEDEMYSMMQLNKTMVLTAQSFINKTKDKYLQENPKSNRATLQVIGVHVRRGDKLSERYQGPDNGYRIPNATEIKYAMEYLRYKHNHNTVFIVATDDKDWALKNLQGDTHDIVISMFYSPYNDFTTLALCDHLIMTQSSFAWWAAWLLEQRVKKESNRRRLPDIMFNKKPFINGTRLWKNYVREYLYPEHWIAYTDHSIDTENNVICQSRDIKNCFS